MTKSNLEKEVFLNAAVILKDHLENLKDKNLIRQFVDYIFEHVIMITIVSTNKPFAIKLFQVINTRGLDLDNADLFKSHLYVMSDSSDHKKLTATWSIIENIANDVDCTIDDLLTLYTYNIIESNPRKSIYEELIQHKKLKNQPSSKVAYEFRLFCEAYKNICHFNSKLIYSLWYLPNSIFWESILTVAKFTDYQDFNTLIFQIRRLFYCYWIAGYTAAKIKSFSFNLIVDVKKKKPIAEIIENINNKMRDDDVLYLMKQNLKSNDDIYGERWLKPLLIVIEYNQTDDSKVSAPSAAWRFL